MLAAHHHCVNDGRAIALRRDFAPREKRAKVNVCQEFDFHLLIFVINMI